jgi:hypothetical protein
MASHGHEESVVIERSRDCLQIPACGTTADAVLTWLIWRDKYGANSLILHCFTQQHLIVPPARVTVEKSGDNCQATDASHDIFVVNGGLTKPC